MAPPLTRYELQDAQDILESHAKKTYQAATTVETWASLPEIPSIEEIVPRDESGHRISDKDRVWEPEPWDAYQKELVYDASLPINVVDGPWSSHEEYISTHYKLLREDAVANLRRSVAEFSDNPSMSNDSETSIYTHVTVIGLHLRRNSAAFRVSFCSDKAGKQINWKNCKRLLEGSLVALSPQGDHFRSICKLAVVQSRDLVASKNPPEVDLSWANPGDVVFDPVQKYVMIEARQGFFEASRHMLVGMQKLMTERSQLLHHVALLDTDIKAPQYLEKNPRIDLQSLQPILHDLGKPLPEPAKNQGWLGNINVLRQLPSVPGNTMDESQLKACHSMITKQIAIVQGPPGTGKTFTSVAAIRILVENLDLNDPPVIISAQTNHALDQLLNHIMKFDDRVVRLGGRSDKENESIRKRTLFELRTANPDVPHLRTGLRQFQIKWDNLVKKTTDIMDSLTRGDVLRADQLFDAGIITKAQRDELLEEAKGDWDNGNTTDGDKDDSSDSDDQTVDDDAKLAGEIAQWVGMHQLSEITLTPQINLNLPIEEEELDFTQAEQTSRDLTGAVDFQNEDARVEQELIFKRRLTGGDLTNQQEKRIEKLLANVKLRDISKHLRAEVYSFWEKRMNAIVLDKFRRIMQQFEMHFQEYQVAKNLLSIKLMRHLDIKVIGCTTTGLSKYRGLISAMRPRTLLIEEAAETCEGMILGGLVETLEQLILVGDHQQLQSRCNVRALEESPYHLKVSMFERMVNNSFPYTMLNTQRRMIPEIRKLLCIEPQPFYRNLHDHQEVLDPVMRPPIPGMGGRNVYFFHHNWPEARNPELSWYNQDEAQMIAGFYLYLVHNGVSHQQITVLTFYTGQRKKILELLRKTPVFSDRKIVLKVVTVDGYQGEENDVILLSLVRSNQSLNIGFLDNKNRLVVALSRARRGLYIFGNTITLTVAESTDDYQGRDPLWDPLVEHMKRSGSFLLDGGLPITCVTHGNTVRLTEAEHWLGRAGGCDEVCGGMLQCGHICGHKCHPFSHDQIICTKACPRLVESCCHGCSKLCGETCRCDLCEPVSIRKNTATGDAFSDDEKPSGRLRGLKSLIAYPNNSYGKPRRGDIAELSNQPFVGHSGSEWTGQPSSGFGEVSQAKTLSFSSPMTHPKDKVASPGSDKFKPAFEHAGRYHTPISKERTPSVIGPIYKGKAPPFDEDNQPKSTPRSWQEWNAQKADKALAEKQQLSDRAARKFDSDKFVFAEKYIAVSVQDGTRVNARDTLRSVAAPREVSARKIKPRAVQQTQGFGAPALHLNSADRVPVKFCVESTASTHKEDDIKSVARLDDVEPADTRLVMGHIDVFDEKSYPEFYEDAQLGIGRPEQAPSGPVQDLISFDGACDKVDEDTTRNVTASRQLVGSVPLAISKYQDKKSGDVNSKQALRKPVRDLISFDGACDEDDEVMNANAATSQQFDRFLGSGLTVDGDSLIELGEDAPANLEVRTNQILAKPRLWAKIEKPVVEESQTGVGLWQHPPGLQTGSPRSKPALTMLQGQPLIPAYQPWPKQQKTIIRSDDPIPHFGPEGTLLWQMQNVVSRPYLSHDGEDQIRKTISTKEIVRDENIAYGRERKMEQDVSGQGFVGERHDMTNKQGGSQLISQPKATTRATVQAVSLPDEDELVLLSVPDMMNEMLTLKEFIAKDAAELAEQAGLYAEDKRDSLLN